MKIYIASSWRNEKQPVVVQAIESAGHEVYDFRNPSMGPGKCGKGFYWSDIDPKWAHWTADELRLALLDPIAADCFDSDLAGMKWADAFVLVMPCGRSAHLELGWAIGAGKPSVILLDDGEPELAYELADYLAVHFEEMLRWLASIDERVGTSKDETRRQYSDLSRDPDVLFDRIRGLCHEAFSNGVIDYSGAVHRIHELLHRPDPKRGPLTKEVDRSIKP